MRPTIPFLAATLLGAVLVAGCSDDEPTKVEPNLGEYSAALTLPEHLINDLMVSYRKREIGPYANLLAADFRFHLYARDAGDVPGGVWDRDQDIMATENLFEDPEVTRITVALQWFPPQPHMVRGIEVQRVDVSFTDLKVDIDGGNTTLQVNGDRQILYFVTGRSELGEDPGRLYLLEWFDLGGDSLRSATEPTTWTRLKLFAE